MGELNQCLCYCYSANFSATVKTGANIGKKAFEVASGAIYAY